MNEFIRFGISPDIGRFCVEVWTANAGAVCIRLGLVGASPITYVTTIADIEESQYSVHAWCEWLARVAIAQQCETRTLDLDATGLCRALDICVKPWAGELLPDAVAGASIRAQFDLEERLSLVRARSARQAVSPLYESHGMQPLPESESLPGSRHELADTRQAADQSGSKNRRDWRRGDRRHDCRMAGIVQRGVNLQRIAGDTAAVVFLLDKDVPQFVVVRSLATANSRRNSKGIESRRRD